MKPLNLEETRLKEEMKSRCLNKGQYIDENAKAKFNMLCHLEDFEIEYWNLQQENQELKADLEMYENGVYFSSEVDEKDKEIDKLKKQLENANKQIEQYQEEVCILDMITDENIKYKNQQKEFISYLENEKDRLARECSQIYEDSLGKIRLVNEDIFNEVNKNLSKFKEIIGGK